LDILNDRMTAIETPGAGAGPSLRGTGRGSVQIGHGAHASGENSSAMGSGAGASGSDSTALGHNANASGHNSTALGQNAEALGSGSTALGQNAAATGSNSVAVGQGSRADRDNSVSLGSAGNERQLTHVAPGAARTDAVNKGQMDYAIRGVRRDAFSGVAAAMAVAGLPQPTRAGMSMVSVAGATYGGESGMALGVSHVTRANKCVMKFSCNMSSRGDVGLVVGAGYQW
jgi:autotransporter adhesin